jgi:hypothetical protein
MIQRSVHTGARIGLAGAERPVGELQFFQAASLSRLPGGGVFPILNFVNILKYQYFVSIQTSYPALDGNQAAELFPGLER